MLTLKVDISEFNRLRDKTIRELRIGTGRAVISGLQAGAEYARANHPHEDHTRTLVGPALFWRIDRISDNGAWGWLLNQTPYARFVEYGTKPHQIWPKEGHGFTGPLRKGQGRRAKTDIGTHRIALKWVQGGQKVFARMVNHPGAKPHPFMRPAAEVARERIVHEVQGMFKTINAFWG